ncbi:MAG: hypothetical protein LBR31_05670 [Desulfovibrio sp.]|nr:hypothetical protein [Desulfovibrio sp.]
MRNDVNDNQSLWVNDSLLLFSEVQRKKLPVGITCCISLDGGDCVDVLLEGVFSEVKNNTVSYTINKMTPLEGKSSGDEKNCTFSFIHEKSPASGAPEKLTYTGHGVIGEVKKSKDGKPVQLSLRLAPQLTSQKTRREPRISWEKENTKALWYIVVPERPVMMEEFRKVISAHYKSVQTNTDIEMQDISPGGTCLRVKTKALEKKLFVGDFHVLFFLPKNRSGNPYVFLTRPVTGGRKIDDEHSLVHLRFSYELDWSKSREMLKWVDIQKIGSERVRRLVQSLKQA